MARGRRNWNRGQRKDSWTRLPIESPEPSVDNYSWSAKWANFSTRTKFTLVISVIGSIGIPVLLLGILQDDFKNIIICIGFFVSGIFVTIVATILSGSPKFDLDGLLFFF